MATIQGVYLALFGRPADPLGLQFFNAATNNGANLAGIGPLQSSAEYQARFTGQSNIQIINSIYQSLFNRDADLPGLTFFANALANGTLTINNIAIAIYDGAQGADLTIRNLKEAAANAFTAAVDTTPEVLGYQGNAAAAAARAFIAGVTTTAPTAAQIDAAVAASVAAGQGGGGTPGLTFTLTNAAGGDILDPNSATAALKTTANDDTIRALADGDLQTADVINAGGGVDTLRVNIAGAADAAANDTQVIAAAVSPTLTSVEKIFVNATLTTVAGIAGGGLDGSFAQIGLGSSTGYTELWNEGSTVNNPNNADTSSGVLFSSVKLGTTIGVKDTATSTSVAFSSATGAADSATVVLSKAAAGAFVRADGIETINLQSTAGPNDVGVGSNTLETVNVSGSTALTLGLGANAATLKTVASTSSGAVTVNLGGVAYTNDVSVTLGSGADTVNGVGIGRKITVSSGDGADTINIDASKASSVTTGGGADTITIKADNAGSTLASVTTAAKLASDAVVITDFTNGTDKITVDSATARVNLTGTQLAEVAAQTDLLAATNKALSYNAGGETLAFQFGSDTYIVANNGADNTIDAGDAIIKLTGVTLAAADLTVV